MVQRREQRCRLQPCLIRQGFTNSSQAQSTAIDALRLRRFFFCRLQSASVDKHTSFDRALDFWQLSSAQRAKAPQINRLHRCWPRTAQLQRIHALLVHAAALSTFALLQCMRARLRDALLLVLPACQALRRTAPVISRRTFAGGVAVAAPLQSQRRRPPRRP